MGPTSMEVDLCSSQESLSSKTAVAATGELPHISLEDGIYTFALLLLGLVTVKRYCFKKFCIVLSHSIKAPLQSFHLLGIVQDPKYDFFDIKDFKVIMQ